MTLKKNWESNYYHTVDTIFESILEPVSPVKEELKYYQETPKELLFTSDSLFTRKFYKELGSILGVEHNAGKKFKRLSAYEKKKVSDIVVQTIKKAGGRFLKNDKDEFYQGCFDLKILGQYKKGETFS